MVLLSCYSKRNGISLQNVDNQDSLHITLLSIHSWERLWSDFSFSYTLSRIFFHLCLVAAQSKRTVYPAIPAIAGELLRGENVLTEEHLNTHINLYLLVSLYLSVTNDQILATICLSSHCEEIKFSAGGRPPRCRVVKICKSER